jgi:hypothetical protein
MSHLESFLFGRKRWVILNWLRVNIYESIHIEFFCSLIHSSIVLNIYSNIWKSCFFSSVAVACYTSSLQKKSGNGPVTNANAFIYCTTIDLGMSPNDHRGWRRRVFWRRSLSHIGQIQCNSSQHGSSLFSSSHLCQRFVQGRQWTQCLLNDSFPHSRSYSQWSTCSILIRLIKFVYGRDIY